MRCVSNPAVTYLPQSPLSGCHASRSHILSRANICNPTTPTHTTAIIDAVLIQSPFDAWTVYEDELAFFTRRDVVLLRYFVYESGCDRTELEGKTEFPWKQKVR